MTKLNWEKRFSGTGGPHFAAKPENTGAKKVEIWSDREIREARKSYKYWNRMYLDLVAVGKNGKKARAMAQGYLKRIKDLGGNA
jgi:hypothetical protein